MSLVSCGRAPLDGSGASPGPLPGINSGQTGRLCWCGRWDCPMPLWPWGLHQGFGGAGEAAALRRDVLRGLWDPWELLWGSAGARLGSRLSSWPGPVGQHHCARLWAGDGVGTQQPLLTETFGSFCHHRCHSTGSGAREGVPRILINLFSDIFSSLDWIFFSMHTLPSEEESVGIAPRSLKRSQSQSCVLGGIRSSLSFSAGRILPWLSQIAKGLEPEESFAQLAWLFNLCSSQLCMANAPMGLALCSRVSLQCELLGGFAGQIQPGTAAVGCPSPSSGSANAGVSGGLWHVAGAPGSGRAHQDHGPAACGASQGTGAGRCWQPELIRGVRWEHSPLLLAGSWQGYPGDGPGCEVIIVQQ